MFWHERDEFFDVVDKMGATGISTDEQFVDIYTKYEAAVSKIPPVTRKWEPIGDKKAYYYPETGKIIVQR